MSNEELAKEKLMELGFNPKYRGFDYLVYFITNFTTDELVHSSVCELSQKIAVKFNLTHVSLPKCFNSMTEAAFKTHNFMLKKLFPDSDSYSITIKNLMYTLHQYVTLFFQ